MTTPQHPYNSAPYDAYNSPSGYMPPNANYAGYNQNLSAGIPQNMYAVADPNPEPPLHLPWPGASFMGSFKRFWKKYATFSGRASRSEFWWAYLANTLAMLILALSIFLLIGIVLFPVYTIAIIIPSIAVTVRRLHDANYSGYWALGYYVTEVVVSLMMEAADNTDNDILLGFSTILYLALSVANIYFMVQPSNPAGVRFDAPTAPLTPAYPHQPAYPNAMPTNAGTPMGDAYNPYAPTDVTNPSAYTTGVDTSYGVDANPYGHLSYGATSNNGNQDAQYGSLSSYQTSQSENNQDSQQMLTPSVPSAEQSVQQYNQFTQPEQSFQQSMQQPYTQPAQDYSQPVQNYAQPEQTFVHAENNIASQPEQNSAQPAQAEHYSQPDQFFSHASESFAQADQQANVQPEVVSFQQEQPFQAEQNVTPQETEQSVHQWEQGAQQPEQATNTQAWQPPYDPRFGQNQPPTYY